MSSDPPGSLLVTAVASDPILRLPLWKKWGQAALLGIGWRSRRSAVPRPRTNSPQVSGATIEQARYQSSAASLAPTSRDTRARDRGASVG
jgi:hypothetical protein